MVKHPPGSDAEQTAPVSPLLSSRLAKVIDANPGVRDAAVELGMIDAAWLAAPAARRPKMVAPAELVRRLLERVVERNPSTLSAVGLNAVEVLSWGRMWDRSVMRGKDTGAVATVVFTDLEGFTGYTSAHGDQAARELLVTHLRTATPIVRRWNGRIVKRLGDGLMLAFPDAADGVHAALALIAAAPAPLRLRAGVHTGEVVITNDDVLGNVVNIAARVTEVAKGAQVLATADTITAAGDLGGVHVTRARRRSLKGVGEKVAVSQVRPQEG